MSRIGRRLAIAGAWSCFFIITVGVSMYMAGARINISKSIPLGLYWVRSKAAHIGDYIIFCPPQTDIFKEAKNRGYIQYGFCPGGYGKMMKKILAAKGDSVKIGMDGISVNGKLLPHTKPLARDKSGRPLPQLINKSYLLRQSELLLMTDHSETSFDARYFGPVDVSKHQNVISPIYIW